MKVTPEVETLVYRLVDLTQSQQQQYFDEHPTDSETRQQVEALLAGGATSGPGIKWAPGIHAESNSVAFESAAEGSLCAHQRSLRRSGWPPALHREFPTSSILLFSVVNTIMTGMRSRRNLNGPRLTRRAWTLIWGAAPLAVQAAQNPPTAEPAAPSNLDKAIAEVRQVSERLSQLEVPMNVEPAFAFKA